MNYYNGENAAFSPLEPALHKASVSTRPKTFMGWDITPDALGEAVRQIRGYTSLPLYITENGSCWDDRLEGGEAAKGGGVVHDAGRVDYLMRHLAEVEKLNAEGLDIAGYYCWSLMDNFEWAFGYTRRFGIVYVDFATQRRIPKDSFYAYQKYIAERRAQK
jgi:beta-glucosidase